MSLNLILDNGAVWDRRSIDFYSENRSAYFDEEDIRDLNEFEGTPRISSGCRYYRVEHNNEVVGELIVTPDQDDKNAEEITIAIYYPSHGYATEVIKLFLEEFAERSKIFARVKSRNPNLSKMRAILNSCGFEAQKRLIDEIPNLPSDFVDDYLFKYQD